MSQRECPGCQCEMQGLRVGEIELDGCGVCGSLWFDYGELEAVAGKRPNPLRIGPRDERCPDCRSVLMEVRFGHARGAACSGCEGLFFGPDGVAALAESGLPASAKPHGRLRRSSVLFRCQGCERLLPLRSGETEQAITRAFLSRMHGTGSG